eukprot:6165567-Amphidinium_carterae.3
MRKVRSATTHDDKNEKHKEDENQTSDHGIPFTWTICSLSTTTSSLDRGWRLREYERLQAHTQAAIDGQTQQPKALSTSLPTIYKPVPSAPTKRLPPSMAALLQQSGKRSTRENEQRRNKQRGNSDQQHKFYIHHNQYEEKKLDNINKQAAAAELPRQDEQSRQEVPREEQVQQEGQEAGEQQPPKWRNDSRDSQQQQCKRDNTLVEMERTFELWQQKKGYSTVEMLQQGVACYYNDTVDLKYMMIAKSQESDENNKNDRLLWNKVIVILGLVEDNEEWLAAADCFGTK